MKVKVRSQALLAQQVPNNYGHCLLLGGWLAVTGNLLYLYGLGLPLAVLAKLLEGTKQD